MRTIFLASLLQLCSLIALGQEGGNQKKLRLVEIPRDEVLMVVVNQPGCPLKIEEVSFLRRLDDGKIIQRYKVRNVSAKSIENFTVTSLSMTGSGGTLPLLMTDNKRMLDARETMDSLEGENFEILPLTEELRAKLKREHNVNIVGKPQNVFFLMIDWVRFADGSLYKDKAVKEALGEYLGEHYRYPDN